MIKTHERLTWWTGAPMVILLAALALAGVGGCQSDGSGDAARAQAGPAWGPSRDADATPAPRPTPPPHVVTPDEPTVPSGGGRGSGGEAWSTKEQSVPALEADNAVSLNVPDADPTEVGDLREAAVVLLRQAADSSSPLLRANAIEALQQSPSDLVAVLPEALRDDNRGVRFAAVMSVGKMRLQSLADEVEPLVLDPSDSVRAAAIYALRRCGRAADPTPLSGMLESDDMEVKGNAVFILGELGEPSAVPMLRDALRNQPMRVPVPRRRVVELQVAEALVKLGKEDELEVIRAALFLPLDQGMGELTLLACQMVGGLKDATMQSALGDMATRKGPNAEPPEIQLAATQALAMIDSRRVPTFVAQAYVVAERPEIRAQAASALGWTRDRAVLPALATLLNDPNPAVQVAAAGALLRVDRP